MKHLERILSFKETVWQPLADQYAKLLDGQKPWAFVVTCSDSRYYGELLLQAQPGELFCLRNAGNMVPPYTKGSEGSGTLQYAINVLEIKHVIILGHYGCGLVQAAISRPKAISGLEALSLWVDKAHHDEVANWDTLDGEQQRTIFRESCQQHVVQQLANLKTHPCLQAHPDVQLHGLIFDWETGIVEEHDATTNLFTAVQRRA